MAHGGYYDELGTAMTAGDLTGDGVDDIVISDDESGSLFAFFGGTD